MTPEERKAATRAKVQRFREKQAELEQALSHPSPDDLPRHPDATPPRRYCNASTEGYYSLPSAPTWRPGQDDALAVMSRGMGT